MAFGDMAKRVEQYVEDTISALRPTVEPGLLYVRAENVEPDKMPPVDQSHRKFWIHWGDDWQWDHSTGYTHQLVVMIPMYIQVLYRVQGRDRQEVEKNIRDEIDEIAWSLLFSQNYPIAAGVGQLVDIKPLRCQVIWDPDLTRCLVEIETTATYRRERQ